MNKPIINPPTGPTPEALKKLDALWAIKILQYEAKQAAEKSA